MWAFILYLFFIFVPFFYYFYENIEFYVDSIKLNPFFTEYWLLCTFFSSDFQNFGNYLTFFATPYHDLLRNSTNYSKVKALLCMHKKSANYTAYKLLYWLLPFSPLYTILYSCSNRYNVIDFIKWFQGNHLIFFRHFFLYFPAPCKLILIKLPKKM